MSETTPNTATSETKTTKGKAPKKGTKTRVAAKAKTPKAAKPAKSKAEDPPREDRSSWCTFALKLPVEEREAFHRATGAAGASRFARIVLNAFSNDDVRAFEAAIAEARKLR